MVGMSRDEHVERLMEKLLRAVQASLAAADAAREAVEEFLRRGDEPGIPFGNPESDGLPQAASDPALTDLDRKFLKSIAIRPESH
jgi:hypothetical protein